MIDVLVRWEDKKEIDKAQRLATDITEFLRKRGEFSGFRTVNRPEKTFGVILTES